MIKRLTIVLAITGLLSTAAWGHPAKPYHLHFHSLLYLAKKGEEQDSPKMRAVEKAKSSPDDKVLKITPIEIDGQVMYKIKLLTQDGRVKIVLVEKE